MDRVTGQLTSLAGQTIAGLTVEAADSFAYEDPIDGSKSSNQGLRIRFTNGARAVFRLSGTGTEGATLRLYIEQLETDPDKLDQDVQTALSPVIAAAHEIAGIAQLNRSGPDVIT